MASNEAPDIVVGRLPIYLRALTFMAEDGQEITSSQELSEKLGSVGVLAEERGLGGAVGGELEITGEFGSAEDRFEVAVRSGEFDVKGSCHADLCEDRVDGAGNDEAAALHDANGGAEVAELGKDVA